MPHPDQKYIEALVHHNEALIREIYDNFSGMILGMVRQNHGHSHDAKDIFQEALIIIYEQARDNGLVLTCPFRSYLWIICSRRWLNRIKRQKKIQLTIEPPDGYTTEEDALMTAELAILEYERGRLFREKLNDLSRRCRQILRLVFAGVKNEEIARQLDIDADYVRTKKSECKARLTKVIQQSPDFPGLKF